MGWVARCTRRIPCVFLLLGVCGSVWSEPRIIIPTLINGEEVDPLQWRQVVRLEIPGSGSCTGAIIGPRVLVTAAHCSGNGATASFASGGKVYSVRLTQSPLWATQNHDLSLGLISEPVSGVSPFNFGGTPTAQQSIALLGYGCTSVDQRQSDGKLRLGRTQVDELHPHVFTAQNAAGVLLCPGDSGGPALVEAGGRLTVLGINAGVGANIDEIIVGPNYLTRIDHAEHRAFFERFMADNGAQICGLNLDCGNVQPQNPSCTLSVEPAVVRVGQGVTATLVASGPVVSATIGGVSVGVPQGSRSIPADRVGSVSLQGMVHTGAGQSATCTAQYQVVPNETEVPLHGVLAAYCGLDQNAATSGVARVCIGMLKTDAAKTYPSMKEVVHIAYVSGEHELMPVLAERSVSGVANRKELALYTGRLIAGATASRLDMRLATLHGGQVPSVIEGQTVTGRHFNARLSAQR